MGLSVFIDRYHEHFTVSTKQQFKDLLLTINGKSRAPQISTHETRQHFAHNSCTLYFD